MRSMKCLVTGAPGFLGTTIVHALVQEGHSVRAMGLPESETRYIQNLCGDIVDDAYEWYRAEEFL